MAEESESPFFNDLRVMCRETSSSVTQLEKRAQHPLRFNFSSVPVATLGAQPVNNSAVERDLNRLASLKARVQACYTEAVQERSKFRIFVACMKDLLVQTEADMDKEDEKLKKRSYDFHGEEEPTTPDSLFVTPVSKASSTQFSVENWVAPMSCMSMCRSQENIDTTPVLPLPVFRLTDNDTPVFIFPSQSQEPLEITPGLPMRCTTTACAQTTVQSCTKPDSPPPAETTTQVSKGLQPPKSPIFSELTRRILGEK